MKKYLLKNANIITNIDIKQGEIIIENDKIKDIIYYNEKCQRLSENLASDIIVFDLKGRYVIAGAIDAHVHFREPGMCHKATIETESLAGLYGGVTSFLDMPNTNPPTTNLERIKDKLNIAKDTGYMNYGFNIGATNNNIDEIERLCNSDEASQFGAIKVFMGSSTGDMLVDDNSTLSRLFQIKNKCIMIHSEDEVTIRENLKNAKEKYQNNIPFCEHPNIRSKRACILSTIKAIELANKYQTHLHILHVSTYQEAQLIKVAKRYNPNITAETSSNYLWFSSDDYNQMKGKVKCNPAIKTEDDRLGLIEAVKEGIIDTIGSDHAPHLENEKNSNYLTCPSGLPTIGESIKAIATICHKNKISFTRMTQMLSYNISKILGIKQRGELKKGYFADIVVFEIVDEYQITKNDIRYKCGWSPYENQNLNAKIKMIFLNGDLVIDNDKLIKPINNKQLIFENL